MEENRFEFDTALGVPSLRYYSPDAPDPCRYCRIGLEHAVADGLVTVVSGPEEDRDVLRARLSGTVEGIYWFLVHQGGLLWTDEMPDGTLGVMGVFGEDGSDAPDAAALRAAAQAGLEVLDVVSRGRGRYLVTFRGSGAAVREVARTLGDRFSWSTHLDTGYWNHAW